MPDDTLPLLLTIDLLSRGFVPIGCTAHKRSVRVELLFDMLQLPVLTDLHLQ